MAAGTRGFPNLTDAGFLFESERDGIVWVVVDETFHGLLDGPLNELRGDRRGAIETQRARQRQLDRASDPPAATGGGRQRVFAVATVDQYADAALQCVARCHASCRRDQQLLEYRQTRFITTGLVREIGELGAMVKCQHRERRPLRACHRGAVQVGQLRVGVDLGMSLATEPVFEFNRCGHRGRTGVARDHYRAASVGHSRGLFKRLAPQQTRHQSRCKGVPRAQHVEHLHAFALNGECVSDAFGYFTRDEAATCGTELHDQCC